MIPEILLLVEQIRPRTAQVDDFRAPVPVLLQSGTFETVESVRDTLFPTSSLAFVSLSERGGRSLPLHRIPRTCSDSCQRNIRRRYERVL